MFRMPLTIVVSLCSSFLFAADMYVLTGDHIEKYDTVTGEMTLSFGSGHGLGFTGGFSAHGLAVREDGTVAAEAAPGGTMGPHQYAIFNGATGQHLRSFNVGTPFNAKPFFGDDGVAYLRVTSAGQPANGIRRYSVDTGADLGNFLQPGNTSLNSFNGAIWDRGRMLVNDGSNQFVRHLDPLTGSLQGNLVNHSASMGSMAFSNNRSILFVGSFPDQQVMRFDALTGQFLGNLLQGPSRGLVGHIFNDGDSLFVEQEELGTGIRRIHQYDQETGRYIGIFEVGSFKSFALAVPTNPVPEPTSIVILSLGALAMIRKRRS